jgi:hypothetical protein
MENIATIIYEDKYVRITDKDLTLFWYYFPFGQNKTIKFSEIKEVKMEELKALYGKYRLWGMDLNCHWYPLDNFRFRKTHYVKIDTGSQIKPCFTPDNINEIFHILEQKTNKGP